jgi:glucose/arabinose dehydrogenase
VLAPEYGGDGGKKIGLCGDLVSPVAAYPRPLGAQRSQDLQGFGVPQIYRGGAFIAFHGSWNRAPGAQGGYNVVFQPLRNGATSGDYVVFADGLAIKEKNPGGAAHRPSGFPVAPDGALFISDDKAGRIWRLPMRAIRTCRPRLGPTESLSPYIPVRSPNEIGLPNRSVRKCP